MELSETIKTQIEKVKTYLNKNELAHGEILFNNGVCQILSQSPLKYELILSDESIGEPT